MVQRNGTFVWLIVISKVDNVATCVIKCTSRSLEQLPPTLPFSGMLVDTHKPSKAHSSI